MACIEVNALPAASATLSGLELVPAEQSGVLRKATTAKIAQSATTWNANHNYVEGFITFAGDGNLYRATSANVGQTPESLNIAYWVPYHIFVDLEIRVPEDVATIPAVFTLLAETSISEDATVTIQLADGTYNLTNSQLVLNHPYGSRMQLIGDAADPSAVSITFTALPVGSGVVDKNAGSIVLNDGHTFGYINGITVSKAGGAPDLGHCAFLSFGNSVMNLGPDVIVSGFYAQLAAAEGGALLVERAGNGSLANAYTTSFLIYCDGARVSAPALSGTTINGSSVAAVINHGFVYIPDCLLTVGATSTVFQIVEGSLTVSGGNIGSAATLYSVVASGYIRAVATGVGAYTNFLTLDGAVQYNGNLVVASAESFANAAAITGFEFQAEGTAKTEALQTSTLAIGSGDIATRWEFGRATLVAGTVTIAATWVTANTVIVATYGAGTVGAVLQATISAGVSFTIAEAGGTSTAAISWTAIVPV